MNNTESSITKFYLGMSLYLAEHDQTFHCCDGLFLIISDFQKCTKITTAAGIKSKSLTTWIGEVRDIILTVSFALKCIAYFVVVGHNHPNNLEF